MRSRYELRQFLGSALGVFMLVTGQVGYAAQLALPKVPLYLGITSDPAVFFELDDSGSMDWEILTRQYWHYCAYNNNAYGSTGDGDCGWLVTNGLWRSYTGTSFQYFEYIFNDGDHAYGLGCDGDRQTLERCTAATANADWRVRSSSVNVLYYDPTVTYRPWPGLGNASFSAARSDPQSGTAGNALTRNLAGFTYHVWQDGRGYTAADARPRRGTNINVTAVDNGEVDLWDDHVRVTVNAGDVVVEQVTFAPTTTNLNPTVTALGTLSGAGAQAQLNGRTVVEEQQNVANWYQYARRRSFVAKAAISSVIDSNPSYRYGLSVINQHASLFREIPGAAVSNYTTHNTNLLNALYSFNWPAMGTPLRLGLERTGQYFDNTLAGKTDPITNECQQNFSILFTDGYWNGGNPGIPTADADGDGVSNSVADVAKHYYDTDLSPLANNVPTNTFDLASHQHMVTYGVAFGVQGNLTDVDGDGWPDGLSEASNWGDPTACSDCPPKIDDLWHAGFNAKGAYINAQTPQEVVNSVERTLADIADRTSSAASVALNSLSTQAGTNLYQARFDSGEWHGELVAYSVASTGALGAVTAWDTDTGFNRTTQDWDTGREIITYKPSTGLGVPFRWPLNSASPTATELDAAQVALLNDDPTTGTVDNDGEGQARIEYLRGSDSNEGAGHFYRTRRKLLGDLVHSAPVFVGTPRFRYPDSLEASPYSSFISTYENRTPMVYVGSNDGMVHGFNAQTTIMSGGTEVPNPNVGRELIAYVPNATFPKLNLLTASNYSHEYFVDGDLTAVDAYVSSAWRSVLIGGLRGGGQGYFALDVTNPASSSFAEANAANLALWEFTDRDDVDLGYSYGQASIFKMRNGQWAAILGNGYNNTEADGYASTTGNAVLYILFIEDGMDGTWGVGDYVKIDTGAGSVATPNGLAAPAPVDVNGDYMVDYIYAGDLLGNMWKFDVSDTLTSNWGVAYTSAGNPQPLFQARTSGGQPQPISVRPEVGEHPTGYGYSVYFGTGKYLETGDNLSAGQDTQTFYGIWDRDERSSGVPTLAAFTRSHLLEQKIIKEVSEFGFDLRVSTTDPIVWHPTAGTVPSGTPPSTHLGWYMDLLNTEGGNTNNLGEKQVTNPVLRGDRIIFTTLVPSQSPCDFGGTGWLMEVAAAGGARLDESPFDLNNDGEFDSGDNALVPWDENGDGQIDNLDRVVVSGKKSKVGIITQPGIIRNGDVLKPKEFKYTSGSTAAVEMTVENAQGIPTGRQSWREMFQW